MSVCLRYGYKKEYVETMDAVSLEKFYDMIGMSNKQQQLRDMTAASVPHMKQKDIDKVWARANKTAYPEFYEQEKIMTTTAMAGNIKGKI